jgi:hypothetical protein
VKTASNEMNPKKQMKMKYTLVSLTLLSALLFSFPSRGQDITATGSGNWYSTVPDAPWPGGIVPDPTNGVDVESPHTITVNSNASIAYIYGSGAVVMGTNTVLNILDPSGAIGTYQLGTLDTSAASNTVIYSGNPFWAKHQNYYNLVFSNTVITNLDSFYNGLVNAQDPAAAMTITGDMKVIGRILVQEGADFTVQGDLFLGTNSSWDCSSFNLTVARNTTIGGKMTDLNGALGNNYFNGNVTVITNTIGGTIPGLANGYWDISDVTNWNVGGSLTNQGHIVGHGYGSINFNGTGAISGQPITIPTMVVNGTSTIGTTITLTTNTPTLSGVLVFDLADTNEIILLSYPTNQLTLYYSGGLNVINSGPAPSSGNSYAFFSATNYGGAFATENFPSLVTGLSWVDNLTTSGSIMVTGTASVPPVITQWHYNPVTRQFTLTWTSANSAMYTVRETPSLNNPSWATLQNNIPSGGSTTTATVTVPSGTAGFLQVFQQ